MEKEVKKGAEIQKGKGDKRSKKGKRILGTYGNSRKKKVSSVTVIPGKEKSSSEVGENVTTEEMKKATKLK